MDRLLTNKDFMDRYGVGRSTVYRENAAQRLPFRKVGRSTRIAQSDATAWFEKLPLR